VINAVAAERKLEKKLVEVPLSKNALVPYVLVEDALSITPLVA
jgi:hypothetical protein